MNDIGLLPASMVPVRAFFPLDNSLQLSNCLSIVYAFMTPPVVSFFPNIFKLDPSGTWSSGAFNYCFWTFLSLSVETTRLTGANVVPAKEALSLSFSS